MTSLLAAATIPFFHVDAGATENYVLAEQSGRIAKLVERRSFSSAVEFRGAQ